MVEKSAQEMEQQFCKLLDEYRSTRGSVIPVLQQTQDIFGYLPREILIRIAKELDVPISQIY